jgi:hypothetical protein
VRIIHVICSYVIKLAIKSKNFYGLLIQQYLSGRNLTLYASSRISSWSGEKLRENSTQFLQISNVIPADPARYGLIVFY